MDDRNAYLEEYSSEGVLKIYSPQTAGKGIQYNLAHTYGPIYAKAVNDILVSEGKKGPFRILEYGCGAGMNLLYVFKMLLSKNIPVDMAVGADFSQPLIDAAKNEQVSAISPEHQNKIKFVLAANESLLEDLTQQLLLTKDALSNTFDIIIGVNTFRYACRLNRQRECADAIAALLTQGGYSIMIDMNKDFPFFKTRHKDVKTRPLSQSWLPSLKEYAEPFAQAGLVIVRKKNFCWMPHSAEGVRYIVARVLGPILNIVASRFAMRSLVVAKKPSEHE